MKHIFREHNQEADHLASMGAEGQRKITVETGNNAENWKAVLGFWDGSTKTDEESGCGVVIKMSGRLTETSGSQQGKLQCRCKRAQPCLLS